jgi:hypothetical protein
MLCFGPANRFFFLLTGLHNRQYGFLGGLIATVDPRQSTSGSYLLSFFLLIAVSSKSHTKLTNQFSPTSYNGQVPEQATVVPTDAHEQCARSGDGSSVRRTSFAPSSVSAPSFILFFVWSHLDATNVFVLWERWRVKRWAWDIWKYSTELSARRWWCGWYCSNRRYE